MKIKVFVYVRDIIVTDDVVHTHPLTKRKDPRWYGSIDELNEDKGIRVCKEIEY